MDARAIADGYDVLVPCLDAAYVGVLSAAQDSEDVWIVGTVIDMAPVAPEVVMGSALFDWNELGYQEASGELADGGVHIMGIPEGGIDYVTTDLFSAEGKAAVEEAVAGLKSGELGIQP